MKLPDGVVSLRKVKTVFAGEDAPGENAQVHLTWVLAYNAGIEVGSPRYEAIRTFAGGLKAPPRVAHSVMFLPIAPPDTSQAPPRSEPKPRPARPATKPAASKSSAARSSASKSSATKSSAAKSSAAKSRARRRPRTIAKPAKPAAKAAAKRAARTAGKPAAKRRATRPARTTRTRQRRSRR